ncbi:hypothetical protein [Paenibacillus sp. WC2504]|uniref:hypothetical protein n=1 Tax=Paenibacillus sp. WC2504 TaxID=3461403 RepID=UPI004045B06C
MNLEDKRIIDLKRAFKEYLLTKYSHLKDKGVIFSDAFYLFRYDIGMSFWEVLENERSMVRCRELLEDYFINARKVKNPTSNSHTYMRSIRILKEFIDTTYGGIAGFIGNEQDEEQASKSKERTVIKGTVMNYIQEPNVKAPRPSPVELEKYLNFWNNSDNYMLTESALEKLFLTTYKNNTEIDEVLIKVSALNDFYSTNIFSPLQVAKHIVSLKIDDRLKKGDVTLVNDIASVQMANGKKKNFYSFATKYCSHHNSLDFPIYDSYVYKVLRYFRDIDSFYYFKNDDLKRYIEFKEILLKFKTYYGLEEYNIKDIDKYLWLMGKEKFPNNYS